jgi:hypothetical protein
MSDLRDHLFEMLEKLNDAETPVDLDRAKLACEVSKNLIESAKVEVQFLKVVDARESRSNFFGKRDEEERALPPARGLRTIANG